MARPRKSRSFETAPEPVLYIPSGWTRNRIEASEIAIEDFEVVRIVDGHGHTIEEAAAKVGVSRSTAGRMLQRARRGLAQAIERQAPILVDAGEDLVVAARPDSAGTRARASGNLVAVACSSAKPEAPVERLFGRAPAFALRRGGADTIVLLPNPGARSGRNAAVRAVNLLSQEGVERVIAGRFGRDALTHLGSAGIRAHVAAGLTVEQAFFDFK